MELAKTCARTCHVLKTLSGPSEERIMDIGRCVDQTQPPLLAITNDTRTVRHIESAVRERANCTRDSQEPYPESTNDCVVFCRTKLLEKLRALDVCGFQFMLPTAFKPP